jgi:TRAP-type C4-dicarboxylate transport system permease small subunit
VTVSILGRWSGLGPVPGDFEFVQMATALAVFAFFPYCQAKRGNIVVDVVTQNWPARAQHVLDAMWDLVWAGFGAIIAWRLFVGAGEAARNGTTTMMLALPVAPAIYVAAVLAGVLSLVAAITALMLLRGRS